LERDAQGKIGLRNNNGVLGGKARRIREVDELINFTLIVDHLRSAPELLRGKEGEGEGRNGNLEHIILWR